MNTPNPHIRQIKYIPALDGIRAIAVLAIIAFHAKVPGTDSALIWVDVFFVLSGFLITSILLKEFSATNDISLRTFYINRFLRLFPALLLLLATYIIVAPIVWPKIPAIHHIRDAIVSGFYISNYTKAFYNFPSILSHTWTLSVEEQFYLVWPPLLLLLLKAGGRKTALAGTLFLFLLAWAWRNYSDIHNLPWIELYTRFDTRCSSLIIGAALAFAPLSKIPAPMKALSAILTIPLIAYAIATTEWRGELFFREGVVCGQAIAIFSIIAATNSGSLFSRILENPSLMHIGKLSYSAYLWHYPILYVLRAHFEWQYSLAMGLPASIILAQLSYYSVERWAKRIKTRRESKNHQDLPLQPIQLAK